MSRIVNVMRKCSVCGTVSEYMALASTNNFGGGPDLDLRPAEMMRSTMNVWLQRCPGCGYVSEDVSDLSRVDREWLNSDKYRNCDGIPFVSELSKEFYKYYLINMFDKNIEDAFFAVLHAAWSCDDDADIVNAKHCRELAIELATRLLDKGYENEDSLKLTRADLMRRAGQFEKMISMYETVEFDEELLNQILKFEIEKAHKKDSSCYRVEDVVGNC